MTDDPTKVQQRDGETYRLFQLVGTGGPAKGIALALGEVSARIFIGKDASATHHVDDPEMSRRHAAFERASGGSIRIVDLGSTNGTFVDRVQIQSAILRGGEFVRLGGSLFRVEAIDGEQPTPDSSTPQSFGMLVGDSPAMRHIYALCERLAAADVPAILEGETGTGKEVLAESIHNASARASGPFVVFDCTTAAATLLESELFGHERGAFTGAHKTRPGVFEEADGGTLLIDEIGDLDISLQAKLLRAIEKREVRRLGGDKWLRFNVRVLAATRRNLDREIEAARFRDDLFHRLAVGRIEMPPLRERAGDVRLLATLFWQQMGGMPGILPEEVLARWSSDPWPGNVRELRNAVARYLAFGDSLPASASPRPSGDDFLTEIVTGGLGFSAARDRLLEEFERRFIEEALRRHGGRVAEAAAASGIGARYFRKLRQRQQ